MPIAQFRISRQTVEQMAWGAEPVSLLRGLGPRMDWMLERGFREIPLWEVAPQGAQQESA
jgi:hypothetical protein